MRPCSPQESRLHQHNSGHVCGFTSQLSEVWGVNQAGPCFTDPFSVTWGVECERVNAPDAAERVDFKQPCSVTALYL